MQEVLTEKIALVSLSIATFAGYRRVTREQIEELGGSLPASAAITEGSIKVFPCDGVKGLTTVRRAIFRKVESRGIKALGSRSVFAVPRDQLAEIEQEISDAETEFASEKATLDAQYEVLFEAHVKNNLVAEPIIRARKVARPDALARCKFSFHIFSITPIVRAGVDAEDGIENMVRGLGRQLYEEVAGEMVSLLDNKAFVAMRVGQKTLRPIRAQVEKMKGLTFLDDAIDGTITLIEATLKNLPQAGYIEGQGFLALQKLIEIASDADELYDASCRVKNGIPYCDVLFPRVVAPVVVASVQTQIASVPAAAVPVVAAVPATAVAQAPVGEALAAATVPAVPPKAPLVRALPVRPVSVPPRALTPSAIPPVPGGSRFPKGPRPGMSF